MTFRLGSEGRNSPSSATASKTEGSHLQMVCMLQPIRPSTKLHTHQLRATAPDLHQLFVVDLTVAIDIWGGGLLPCTVFAVKRIMILIFWTALPC